MSDKTLIIGPSWVGDMVMAQALFKAIKSLYPETQIDVLAPEWSRPLTDRMPEVNESISIPLKHGELGLAARFKLVKEVKSRQYQRCYVLPNSFKSALIPFFARIPHRFGWMGEYRFLLLTKWRHLNKDALPLMVQRYVALAGQTNWMPFRPLLIVKQENIKSALACYDLHTDKPIMVLCPGAEFGPSKRWPESNYAVIANEYLKRGWQIWILGSAKDSEVARLILEKTRNQCIDLTGKTTLSDAIDLLSLAHKVVTNDSGLMHIAGALNRPLVAVYGPTDPSFTPPLNDNKIIVKENMECSPCFKRICPLQHHRCMQALSPEKVLMALDNL